MNIKHPFAFLAACLAFTITYSVPHAAAAPPKQQLTDEVVDTIAKTDNVGLLDNNIETGRTTALRIGQFARPAKVVSLATEILDGKTQFKHVAYANRSLQAVGFCMVANKDTPPVLDSLYRVLQRVMFEHVAQLDLADEETPRLRLLKNGVLKAIDTMVSGGVVPPALLNDLKRLNADPALPPELKATISQLAGAAALQSK